MTSPSHPRGHEQIRAVFDVLDERMNGLGGDRYLTRLGTGGRWLEGPAYFPASRTLIFSDIPNDRLLRYDETTRRTSVFANQVGHHNGHSVDRAGRLLCAEHGNRRVSRVEVDGSITVIAEAYEGKRLNSPNDLVERSDGSIWFTDPAYGIDTDYEGYQAVPEQDGCHVYRADPDGSLTKIADDFARPNGIAFSLDERTLYVSDTAPDRKHVRAFSVADDGSLSGGDVIIECQAGVVDGFRVDDHDRLWCSAEDGVRIHAADGTLLARLEVPEVVANLTFGGPRRTDLYITATTSLYGIRVNVTGPNLLAR